MITSLSSEQRQRFEATARILEGEDPDSVARDLGLVAGAVRRDADDLISPEQLKPILERMAGEDGLIGGEGGVPVPTRGRREVLPARLRLVC